MAMKPGISGNSSFKNNLALPRETYGARSSQKYKRAEAALRTEIAGNAKVEKKSFFTKIKEAILGPSFAANAQYVQVEGRDHGLRRLEQGKQSIQPIELTDADHTEFLTRLVNSVENFPK